MAISYDYQPVKKPSSESNYEKALHAGINIQRIHLPRFSIFSTIFFAESQPEHLEQEEQSPQEGCLLICLTARTTSTHITMTTTAVAMNFLPCDEDDNPLVKTVQ